MSYNESLIDPRYEALESLQNEHEAYTRDIDYSMLRDMRAEMELDDDKE